MDKESCLTVTLLDDLARKAGCMFLSDLWFLPKWQRSRLAREIEKIPPNALSLREWNDTLDYLTGLPGEQSSAQARSALLRALKRDEKSSSGRTHERHRQIDRRK